MDNITKKQFIEKAVKGIYYMNSAWDIDIDKLEIFLTAKNATDYHNEEFIRIAQNKSNNIKFKTHDGTYSYNDIGTYKSHNVVCDIFSINDFLVTITDYGNSKSIVVYAS